MNEAMEDRLGMEDAAPKRGRGRQPGASASQRGMADERDYDERESQEREYTEDVTMTDDDRFEAFLDSFAQSVLPDLPKMPGFHVCYLTTTNPRDTVANRLRIGYELIRADMLRGMGDNAIKTGDYAGCIGINEMVAARIPISLYKRFMKHQHHDEPLHQEESIKAQIEKLQEDGERHNAKFMMGDGSADVVQRARPANFEDDA